MPFVENFCTVKRSIIQRMDNTIPTVCMGEMVSEIRGKAMMQNAPNNSPFDMPVMITAMEVSTISSQSIDNLRYS